MSATPLQQRRNGLSSAQVAEMRSRLEHVIGLIDQGVVTAIGIAVMTRENDALGLEAGFVPTSTHAIHTTPMARALQVIADGRLEAAMHGEAE